MDLSGTFERWEQVKVAFQTVLEQKPSKRGRFLERLCGHDPALMAEVRALLDAYDESYLERPAASPGLPSTSESGVLGRYRVVESLGIGGMGEVLKVEDELGRSYALKRLPRGLVSHAGLRRFRREIRTISSLRHPNIVETVAVGGESSEPYIVMEYLEGRTLKELLSGGDPLPLGEALEIARQIARGLAWAHAKGVVHRDLKPANILKTTAGHVKILDFGIAKLLSSAGEAGSKGGDGSRITKSGEILGTPEYMAPEQARGEKVDERTDVFAFGCVLYEMLTGHRAFSGESAVSRIAAVLHDEPEPPRRYRPALARTLEETVLRCLKKDPEARPPTMTEVLDVLSKPPDPSPPDGEESCAGSGLFGKAARLFRRKR